MAIDPKSPRSIAQRARRIKEKQQQAEKAKWDRLFRSEEKARLKLDHEISMCDASGFLIFIGDIRPSNELGTEFAPQNYVEAVASAILFAKALGTPFPMFGNQEGLSLRTMEKNNWAKACELSRFFVNPISKERSSFDGDSEYFKSLDFEKNWEFINPATTPIPADVVIEALAILEKGFLVTYKDLSNV